jgi:hypothetical protein
MSELPAAWWDRARRARDELEAQIGGHPAVSLIDIGLLDPLERGVAGLRVHVRGAPADVVVPAEIDGILVRVVQGDYRAEGSTPQ